MSADAAAGSTQLRWVPFVICSAATQLVLMMSLGAVPLPHIQAAMAEISDPQGQVFRRMDDPLMGFMLLSMPVLSSVLLALLRGYVQVALSAEDTVAGVKFALVVWATGALHGIFIDMCTYRESVAVATHFAVSSGLCAAANGFWLARFCYHSSGVEKSA
jgi:hypothetical protein